jgi:hypothetical protein
MVWVEEEQEGGWRQVGYQYVPGRKYERPRVLMTIPQNQCWIFDRGKFRAWRNGYGAAFLGGS